jgi:hypothetical protein
MKFYLLTLPKVRAKALKRLEKLAKDISYSFPGFFSNDRSSFPDSGNMNRILKPDLTRKDSSSLLTANTGNSLS